MKDPKMICLAVRGTAAIAALILTQDQSDLTLHAFSFTDETVTTAMPKAFEMLGLPPDMHVKVVVVVWPIPEGMLDAHVTSKFAAAVQANDVAYFYGITNSKGGQA